MQKQRRLVSMTKITASKKFPDVTEKKRFIVSILSVPIFKQLFFKSGVISGSNVCNDHIV